LGDFNTSFKAAGQQNSNEHTQVSHLTALAGDARFGSNCVTRRKLSDRRKEIMMGVRTRQTSARWLMSFVFFLQGAPAAPPPPPNAKAAAPIDFTGQWVSVVTEDWRYRMITPPKGNYAGVPLNDAARKIADNWDPAKDEAAGAQCKAYGAANIMRVPARIRIS